jgi:hypothetical protein
MPKKVIGRPVCPERTVSEPLAFDTVTTVPVEIGPSPIAAAVVKIRAASDKPAGRNDGVFITFHVSDSCRCLAVRISSEPLALAKVVDTLRAP